MMKPALLITVDTEGDNLWARPRQVETRNATYLPRFQELCEKYGFKPTYLTNWEMAHAPAFVELGRDALRRRTAEIGMHLHAWDTPPLLPLTPDDSATHPYLTEYPAGLLRAKIGTMTEYLEDLFGTKMLSHRAGRFGFDAVYARALVDFGYQVDCSVTPYVSWQRQAGDPAGVGGPDFTSFPADAYFLDLDDIARSGASPLLEVPVTILSPKRLGPVRILQRQLDRTALGRRVAARLLADRWFGIESDNKATLLDIIRIARRERRAYLEFFLHSSELMPGGRSWFPDAASIERLYRDLDEVFHAAAQHFEGQTLAEFRRRFDDSSVPSVRHAV